MIIRVSRVIRVPFKVFIIIEISMPISHLHKTIEVCFSPALFPYISTKENYIVVIVDILRASTSICSAFDHGVKEIIPVVTVDEARQYKEKGYLVAAERDGKKLDFADYGNSPFHFMIPEIRGKTIVYSTTNGTLSFETVKQASYVVVGAFINRQALADWISKQDKNVVILCSGWYNQFNLEDTLFAGALTEALSEKRLFSLRYDSTQAALDLWRIAKKDLMGYIEKASHRHRLRKLGLDDILEYSLTLDISKVIPVIDGIRLINAGL